MRPRLSEIAKLADVSEATVSRVLNAKPGVANDTRGRVLDVLADLGYADVRPEAAGTGAIGIVTPELSNPIFPFLAQQMESAFAHHGYISLVCSSTSETVHEQDFLDFLAAHGASGVVVINGRYALPDVGYEPYLTLRAKGIPVVLVNGFSGEPPPPRRAVAWRSPPIAWSRNSTSAPPMPWAGMWRNRRLAWRSIMLSRLVGDRN